jgi:phage major head subunit gpT-like protein
MGTPFHYVSSDAQRALEEFSMQFTMALSQGPVRQWAKELGFYRQVSNASIKSTYPIPVSAAGYKEFKGDVKYRTLFQKSLSLIQKTWQDGVEELARIIEAPDFTGWMDEPARIAVAGMALANEIIAGQIEANPVLDLDGLTLFNDAHPFNVFDVGAGTFDNDITGAGTNPSIANLKVAKEHFRAIKAPNGKPLGLKLTDILCGPAQEESWRDILEQNLIIAALEDGFGAVDNRHKGTVRLVVADELADDDQWYGLALNKPGMFPWIVEDEGTPEEIRCGKDSQKYKDTLKVSVAYVLTGNGAMALPHCIVRFEGEPPAT